MKVVFQAGGFGKRIREIDSSVPKPLIKIDGIPILEREILVFKNQGFLDFVLIVGYMKEKIISYFDNGSKWGVHITYIQENEPLGTAGALYYLKDEKEDFFLVNSDTIFDIDIKRFLDFHKKKGAVSTIFTHPNSHPFDSSIIEARSDGLVLNWFLKENKPELYSNCVNAGIHIFSPKIFSKKFNFFQKMGKKNLDRDILKELIPSGSLYSYNSSEYVKDVGTPERFKVVEEDIKSGKVLKKSLFNKQVAVFLDRDGTINKLNGFIKRAEDFVLIDNVAKAIKKINDLGLLAIVVTNQPVIARGEATFEDVENIHKKMEVLLGNSGAYLDAIYYCPHHPDKGFEGERAELKIDCNCRKPKIGMLEEAAKRFNIDIKKSWVVGDSFRDIQLAKNAGCRSVLVKSGIKEEKYEEPTIKANDLSVAIDLIATLV